MDELETHAFGDETYYISFLATAMWARGKGLAGVLLRHILDKARAEGRLTTVTASAEYNVSHLCEAGKGHGGVETGND